MLTPFDDYPIHQGPLPVAHVGGGHPDAHERYFFNGYDREGELFFAHSFGIYPNRDVVDASLSVLKDGVQRCVHASGRIPANRHLLEIGPVRLEIVEPFESLRLMVDASELGVDADLVFTASTTAVEAPRVTSNNGAALLADFTRMLQWGSWQGTLRVDGVTTLLSSGRHAGMRDRTWGIRPVDGPSLFAPSHILPQIFRVGTSVEFEHEVIDISVNETADGQRTYESALVIPVSGSPIAMHAVRQEISWEIGKRHAMRATFEMDDQDGGTHRIELEPLITFPMRGLGYTDPEWAHGKWKGELVLGTRSWVVDQLDPTDIRNLHVQQLVKASWLKPDGDRCSGVGVLEQLVVNDHRPSGLKGFLNGAAR